MNIKDSKQNHVYTMILDGSLDTSTVSMFDEKFTNITPEIKEVVLDFTGLAYISSAGLRSILSITELLGDDGIITVKGANPRVKDVLNVTGFSAILNMV